MASSLVMDKKPPEISMERIEIDILGLAMIPIRITPFCTPFGFTNTEPIGCLVADTFKPGSINKCLGQKEGMAVDGFPVI